MFNWKSVVFFLLTILFVTLFQFQDIKANTWVQPQLTNQLAQEHRGEKEPRGRGAGGKYSSIVSSAPTRPCSDATSTEQYCPPSEQISNLYRQGKYQKVIQILSPQKELKPAEEYILAATYQNIGQFSLAVKYWSRAKESYLKRENYAIAGYCLLQLAQGYIQLGRTSDAIWIVQNWSYPLPAYASAIIGNTYLAAGKFAEAIAYYQKTLTKELKSEQRLAVLNNLGSGYEKLALKMEKSAQAIRRGEEKKKLRQKALEASTNSKKTREEAWLIAQNLSHPSAIKAKLNWLKYNNDTKIIDVVAQDIEKLPHNHRQIQLFISLAKLSPQPEIYLQRALQLAQEKKDNLSLAITSAELGKLYEQKQKYEIALTYTEQAEEYIYPLLIYDYLYQYQWQEARIYERLTQPEKAKLAYQRSLDSLQKIRPQIAFAAKNVQFDFQESIEPIYRGLLNLLLRDNPSAADLQKSLAVFEQFQVAQLENLFADVCFAGEIEDITKRLSEENIAIITPIILDKYIHVIVLTPDGEYYHHAQKISSTEINQKIAQWRLDLLDINEQKYLVSSSFFYEIIFQPFEELMARINPSTIVFINDGLLRNVPMATLYDSENQQFLIEKYPLSVALGQNFLPTFSPTLTNDSFAFGLSEAVPPVNIALPNVVQEIKSLENIIDADAAVNREFTSKNLAQKIKENNLSVLHLATHGEFTGLIENSFIQTYDKIITTSELEQILIEAEKIDLLTLSACETAAGDNRAVMGLAGVAIRTGIPSVFSTLWSVSDSTTPKFIEDFYRHWQADKNKAIALQKVQIEQIRQKSHPIIWSPFILIGI